MIIIKAGKPQGMKHYRHILIVLLTATLAACVSAPNRPVAQQNNAPPPTYQNRLPAAPPRVDNAREQPNPALVREIEDLWRSFPGKTGIAIKRIDGEWEFGQRAEEYFPQQSVSKLWVAMTLLDKIDQGRASLSDPIRIGKEDLTVFHQPMAVEVEREGSVIKSVYTLLEMALASSDNTANDALLRHAGGPDAVRSFIAKNNLGKIRFGPGERLLQSGIAGMEWKQDLSYRRTFYAARAKIPVEQRRQSLEAYLADPVDGASPIAIARALDKLARGALLSDNSTKLLQSILKRTHSGPNRLKAGVPAGWEFLHKTGTGQVLGAVATGYNDIGIMTAPDGTRYAVVVMLGDTTASIPERMRMMQAVTRTVARYHPG
ncbi:serine hydrolase [Parasphingorhabdus sp.]|uniref:serine hydrolase n=1 Tax=Parasphingorhabdus sp. TaxID=2709688 RepID=UPI002B26F1FC|nr:serine hydrolase [Parasphingorhabdus sp.]